MMVVTNLSCLPKIFVAFAILLIFNQFNAARADKEENSTTTTITTTIETLTSAAEITSDVTTTAYLIVGEVGASLRLPVPSSAPSRYNASAPAVITKKPGIRANKTRKTPHLLQALGANATGANGTRHHHSHHFGGAGAGGGTSGIGYGAEYADEWPIYVAILGLTVFAYVAWVLVYCLCQRRGGGINYQASLASSTATLELAAQRSYSHLLNQGRASLATITNGAYHHSSNVSIAASANPTSGSPECSLEGASLHEMVPPKYLQAMGANISFTVESANNTLLHCNDDFLEEDGAEETYVVVPRLGTSGSRVSSPPGYSDLTRISVVINAPSSEDDTSVSEDPNGANAADEQSPLVGSHHHHHRHHSRQATMARSVSQMTRQHLEPADASPSNWARRSLRRGAHSPQHG